MHHLVKSTAALVGAVVGVFVLTPAAAYATEDSRPVCEASWQFDPSSSSVSQTAVDTALAQNSGPRPIAYKFTSTRSGTTTFSASVTLGVELKAAVFATVKAEINAGISHAVTATTGVEVSGTVPPRSTVRGTYGVFYVRVHGQKWWQTRECRKTQGGWISVTAPYGRGWRV